jgi:2-phospho-L-lactate guanylyltransferase (CobY/MobA/RfbA family)
MKLEKLHAVLENERAALRDVLQAARKAVDDLKVPLNPLLQTVTQTVIAYKQLNTGAQAEKQDVEDNLVTEKKTTAAQAEEIERLKRLLHDSQSSAGDTRETLVRRHRLRHSATRGTYAGAISTQVVTSIQYSS